MLYSVISNMMFNTLKTGGCLMQHDIIAGSSCKSFQQHFFAAFCGCDNYNITFLDKLHMPEQFHTISD